MKINPSQETAGSLLSTAISRDKLQIDFQASLDVAQQDQRRRSGKLPDAAAMQDAMAAARKELEDYIEKGPIVKMREAILREMGLSEEDVARMPPEQRDALEKTIAARMKEMLLAGTGMDTKTLHARLLDLPLLATEKSEPTV